MTAQVFALADYFKAVEVARDCHDAEALKVLARHHFHAEHCGGYDVLAWPCAPATVVLRKLLEREQ